MKPFTIIEPQKNSGTFLKELWQYRDLFYFLALKDVLIRYKQTAIGVLWAVLRPLLMMAILTVVFGRIARLPSNGIPYPLVVMAAMLAWQFFSSTLIEGANSTVEYSHLISKVYFPRLIIPSAYLLVNMIDLSISFILFLILMALYGVVPTARILALPLFFILAALVVLGMSWWLSALNVKYRDFRIITPFLIQIGLYISPVGFLSSVVPAKWRLLYFLNPMVGVIDGFRFCLLGGRVDLFVPGLLLSGVVALLIFVSGLKFFLKMERSFADII